MNEDDPYKPNNQNFNNQDKDNIPIDLKTNVEITDNQSKNFDLFNDKEKSVPVNHQIDLTEIEQETKDIDEKVLEIPAFLRRQAN